MRSAQTRSRRRCLREAKRAELHVLLAEVRESERQPVEAVAGSRVSTCGGDGSRARRICLSGARSFLLHHAYAPAAEVFAKGHRLYPKSVRTLVGLGSAAYAQDLNEASGALAAGGNRDGSHGPAGPYQFLAKLQEVAKSEPQEWVEAFQRYGGAAAGGCAGALLPGSWRWKSRGEASGILPRARRSCRTAITIDPRLGGCHIEIGVRS